MTQTILIVDDTPANLSLLIELLEDEDFDVQIAEDGSVALEQLQYTQPDLILLDIMMPNLNGIETCQRLKAKAEFAEIPVIFMTALSDMDSLNAAFEAGGVDYVTKPIRREEVLTRVNNHLKIQELKNELRERSVELAEQNAALEASQQKIRNQLEEASRYLLSLLPAIQERPLPTNWVFRPSDELGGDALGYTWLDDHNFAIYLLDVCGHGVGAALLAVTVLNVLRNHSRSNVDFHDPADVITSLNRIFPSELHNGMFFTIWYGVYNTRSRRLSYSSAGHHASVLVEPATDGKFPRIRMLNQPSLAAGITKESQYQRNTCQIDPGSRLYLFSDGAFEITIGKTGKSMHYKEFVAILAEVAREPEEDVQRIMQRIQDLQQDENFGDDFSLLRVEFP